MMKNFILIALAVSTVFLFGASDSLSQEKQTTSNESSYPKPFPLHQAEFSTFLNAMKTAGLGKIFKGTGPFTGFIPSNAAFEKFDKKAWAELQKPENQDKLVKLLTYHMITGRYNIDHLKSMAPAHLKTINGKDLEITADENGVRVNNIVISEPNLEGPNWTVHKIETVLTPK